MALNGEIPRETNVPNPTLYKSELYVTKYEFDALILAADCINRNTGLQYQVRRLTEDESNKWAYGPGIENVAVLELLQVTPEWTVPKLAESQEESGNLVGLVWRIGETALLDHQRTVGNMHIDAQEAMKVRMSAMNAAARMYAATHGPKKQ